MTDELKEALKLIKNECAKHKTCNDCPLNERKINNTYCDEMYEYSPCNWKID